MIQVRLIRKFFHLAIADFSWSKALTPCMQFPAQVYLDVAPGVGCFYRNGLSL
jgi:hypothetical protein